MNTQRALMGAVFGRTMYPQQQPVEDTIDRIVQAIGVHFEMVDTRGKSQAGGGYVSSRDLWNCQTLIQVSRKD